MIYCKSRSFEDIEVHCLVIGCLQLISGSLHLRSGRYRAWIASNFPQSFRYAQFLTDRVAVFELRTPMFRMEHPGYGVMLPAGSRSAVWEVKHKPRVRSG